MPTNQQLENPAGGATDKQNVLVSIRDIKKHFPIKKGFFNKQVGAVRALDGVNLEVFEGEQAN